jgi:hypothetical protein
MLRRSLEAVVGVWLLFGLGCGLLARATDKDPGRADHDAAPGGEAVRAPETAPASAVEHPLDPGAFPYARASTLATVRELFGLNEGLGVPDPIIRRHGWTNAQVLEAVKQRADAATALGVSMDRLNTAVQPHCNWYDFKQKPDATAFMDGFVTTLQNAGLDLDLVIGPWPGNHTGMYTERYVPDDLEAYARWVEGIVERYDGDGQDDAPGLLRAVRWWEVDNEPDLHCNRPHPGSLESRPGVFETPAQYAQIFGITAEAIRKAAPEAWIMNAGTFQTRLPAGRRYLEDVMGHAQELRDLRILSVHAYFDDDEARGFSEALDTAFAVAGGRPVWVTETGLPSRNQDRAEVDESFQARGLAAAFGQAMDRGVERVLWHSLSDPPERSRPPGAGAFFASHDLYRTVNENPFVFERKLAGQVYAGLVEHFGAVPISQVERVKTTVGGALKMGSAGWFVYRGRGVAVPGAAGRTVDLASGKTGDYKGAVDAPAMILP